MTPLASWNIPWLKSAALGSEPYDADGAPIVPFPADPPERSPVFMEGGPASDPNYSLRSIGTEHRWNHRQVAAFRPDGKFLVDLNARDVRRWVTAGDPDGIVPERLAGSAQPA